KNKTQETSYLTVQDGVMGTYIEKKESNQNIRLFEPLGASIPIHLGASRKVILAYNNFETIYELHAKGYLIDRNEEPIDIVEFKQDLLQIKKNKYSVSYGEHSEGACAIAAPIFD